MYYDKSHFLLQLLDGGFRLLANTLHHRLGSVHLFSLVVHQSCLPRNVVQPLVEFAHFHL